MQWLDTMATNNLHSVSTRVQTLDRPTLENYDDCIGFDTDSVPMTVGRSKKQNWIGYGKLVERGGPT